MIISALDIQLQVDHVIGVQVTAVEFVFQSSATAHIAATRNKVINMNTAVYTNLLSIALVIYY